MDNFKFQGLIGAEEFNTTHNYMQPLSKYVRFKKTSAVKIVLSAIAHTAIHHGKLSNKETTA